MQKKSNCRIAKLLIGSTLALLLALVLCLLTFTVYVSFSPTFKIDDISRLAKAQDRTTKLYYTSLTEDNVTVAHELDGESLYSSENREWVRYENIPQNLINAFVAIEDHRFFEHDGIDLKRTTGAIIGFITSKSGYGGSTITQQLIKNVTGDSSYSVSRKIKEIVKAKKLDGALSKEEILELYLNTIYLSHGCYGIGTASELYFGKELGKLTLNECAALACIPQSPTKWDPINNPDNNAARRKTVLYRMHELGFIDENELDQAIDEKLILTNESTHNTENGKIYSWYTESVINEAINLLIQNKIAANEQTAKKLLYTGGLSIITAQNPKMQAALEKYFENESNFYSSGDLIHPECSMVVICPKTGNILALAGATGKKTANRTLNYATATYRSPGSSIKPLSVYAPAIDSGLITYGSVIDDTPVKFVSNGIGGLRGWPQNFPQGYRGLTTVRDAVNRSVNTVAVKVLNMVGAENAFDLLHDKMEMTGLVSSKNKNGTLYTDIAPSPLALGQLTKGVTVAQITAGYTALANGGVYHSGKTVLQIFDSDGKLIVDNRTQGKQLFSEQSAAIMTHLLEGVTNSGTASAMTLKNTVACAGKTGTTTNDQDRWFIGYTPDLIAGVWFGYASPKGLENYPTSPSPALKTFDNVMKIINTEQYLGTKPSKNFPQTEGIVTAKYCRDSGKLVTSACLCDPRGSRIETGYFTKDTLPSEYCDTHVMVKYDILHGGIAGQECPDENCRYVGLINVRRSFPYPVVIADAQYTYQTLESGVPPCLDASKPYFYFNSGGANSGLSAVSFPFNRYCSCNMPKPPEEDFEDGENAQKGENKENGVDL